VRWTAGGTIILYSISVFFLARLANCPLDKLMKIQIKPAGKALVLVLRNSPKQNVMHGPYDVLYP
jgi:hypothetical protein